MILTPSNLLSNCQGVTIFMVFRLQNESKSILCQAHDKIRMFVRRYEITKQRLLRTERFTGPQSGSLVDGAESVRSKLSAIKSVKGQAFAEAKVLFGMLTEMVEGQWFLEDPEEFIKLDFSRVKSVMDGYYCEGAMVLVEGYSTEESFEVHTIEMVPAEQASITRSLQSHPDPLSDCRKEIESRETLCRIMDQQSYSNMLFFSEMHLDNAALMQCFGEILEGCSSDPPAVIVLMGRFLSVVPADGPKAFDAYETAFARLGNLIASHKNIRESSRFVLVPSQSDAFYPNILPRPALPADLFEGLREQGIDFIPASNPCHIKCFTRDIAVLRLDAQSLLERCKIPVIPTPEHDIDVGQILLDQGHLCPFPLGVQPVQWNMAHALSLYPVPDMLCVGDKATACMYPHAGCLYANPGEFFRSGLVYIQYYPSSNRTDLKKLNR